MKYDIMFPDDITWGNMYKEKGPRTEPCGPLQEMGILKVIKMSGIAAVDREQFTIVKTLFWTQSKTFSRNRSRSHVDELKLFITVVSSW